jgi:ABC-type bacteriocin/lantibiotic exporter with double-glycine peptidase domain
MPPVLQQTDSHCGPAVIQALLGHLHIPVSQDEVVDAARARTRIKKHGTRPDQLARAVRTLAPEMTFWVKQQTSKRDLEVLLHDYRWPVAVNWQGLFYSTAEEEKRKHRNADRGHYSIVLGVDVERDKIFIRDPYSEFSAKVREFSLKWFEKRWHDQDTEIDPETGIKISVKTKRLIFVVAPKDAEFPKKLHMEEQPQQKNEQSKILIWVQA